MYWVILALARLALLLQLLEPRDAAVSSWRMIDAVTYGMIPSAKIEKRGERAAAEEAEQAEDAARRSRLEIAAELTPGAGIHEPSR